MTTVVNQSLSPEHFAEITVDSAVKPDVAEARGYRTLYDLPEDRQLLASLGFGRNIWDREETFPALLIPMYRVTGEIIAYQLKPRVPRSLVNGEGKLHAIKYESPRGSVNHLDVPPFTQEHISDPNKPIWVTEGVKKVDALVSQDKAVIGLTGVYNWRRKHGTLGDWEDIPLKGRDVCICFDADAKDNRNVQLAMRRFGAWLESKSVRKVHYLIVPSEYDNKQVKGVDDWFAAGGTVKDLGAVATTTPPGEGPKDASFTDAALTDVVCEEALEGSYCWVRGLGWLAWDGHVWNEVSDTAPTEAVRLWALDQFQKTLAEQKIDPSRDMAGMIAGWRSILSKGRIKALVDLARGVNGIGKDPIDFDADPDLMCVKNGYVDLRTGKLHYPDPDKLMTKSCDADYAPGAMHPMWDKALEALPSDVHEWYRDRIGQAATGHMTPDDLMLILQGDGHNGKSTIASAIQVTFGQGATGYGVLLSDRILLASPDAHPTEFMDLRGARFALLEETPEARRLDVHRLKKVVGTSSITARRIRQDDVTFTASHSLFVNTNFKPIVTETDHGTWRRLALLVFPYTYRRSWETLRNKYDIPMDPRVRDPRTQADPAFRRAVLSWIVAGAQAWYARDCAMLPLPERVRRDTQAWRGETDLILGFAAEMLRFAAEERIGAREMLVAFNEWTDGQGHKPWTEKTFASRFGAHEIVKGHGVEKRKMRPRGAGKEANQISTWVGVTVSDEGPGDFYDPFSPQNRTDPPKDKSPDNEGGPGGPGDLDNLNSRSIARVIEAAGPPGPPQVSEPKSTGVDQSIGPKHEPTPQESEEMDMIFDNGAEDPALDDDPVTDSEMSARIPHDDAQAPCAVISTPGVDNVVPAPHNAAEPRPEGAPVGIDLETRGTDWLRFGSDFIALSGHGTRVDTSPAALVARMRAGGTYVGSNVLGFDMLVLERHTGLRLEETVGRVRDTQLQAMIVDPPTSYQTKQGPGFKSYGLDAVSERVLGEPKDERGKQLAAMFCTVSRCGHGKSKKCDGWENIPQGDPRYSAYCLDDVSRSERIHDALPWTPYMEREMRVQTIMARMTLNGFRVDTDLLSVRIREGEARKAAAQIELRDRFGMPTERITVLKNGTERVTEFKSPLATSEGKKWLGGVYEKYGVKHPPRTEKSGALATGADTLRSLADHPKCPEDLRTLLGLMGIVTSERTIYGTIRDNLVGDRVHPNIWPSQASGRWSVDVGMTVMKKSERSVYLPEPGEVIIAIDLSQIDARIVAAHAQDPAYLEMFAPGRDLHTETAIALLGDAKYRDAAKPISHLANYGGSERRAVAMGHDPKLVHDLFEARKRMFPGLIEWQNRVRETGSAGELLDNGFGRPMRVEPNFAYTQAPAQVGQGGTRDMMAEGLLQLAKDAPECLPMLRAIVHDEVVFSVPAEHTEEVTRIALGAFEREWAPPGATIPVRVTAGATRSGINWANAYGKD
jgi:P4 family phage/plasmid primase-like protien